MNSQVEIKIGSVACRCLVPLMAALVLLAAGYSVVRADYIPPSEVKIRTKVYKAERPLVELGTYEYKVSWQGLAVANATVLVSEQSLGDRGYFKVEATAKTGKVIDWFYKMRHKSESLFRKDSMEPRTFSSFQRENSRRRYRQVSFADNGDITTRKWRNGKEKDEEFFKTENSTFDPISAAFLAKSLPLELKSIMEFDVYNGKHRYLISFEVVGKEKVHVMGKTRDAFKVIPRVQKLTDSDGEKRLRSATVWISADNRREILKLESEVLVGSVKAQLVRFVPKVVPDEGQPLGATMASRAKKSKILIP
jgi:hypothetical protein